jgi:hypothetical protein
MGIALRMRWASGWWSLVCAELLCWKPEGVYGFGADERTKDGVGCSWCWRGDCSGEPLDSDERSEPDEWMDWSCSSRVSAGRGESHDIGGWQISRVMTYIILSEQMERAEHLVVLDVERTRGLEVALECKHRRRLDVELLRGAHLAELLVVLLGRDARRPPRAAGVVVVRVGVEVLRLLVLTSIVEELRHGDWRCWCCCWLLGWEVGEGSEDGGRATTTKAKQRGLIRGRGRQRLRKS